MKDKEKQIEEMAKFIKDNSIIDVTYGGKPYADDYENLARKLLEHYQPKLPEDSVVLSRDNYNRLKRDSELYEARHEEKLKLFEKAYNQGSKETAEKIFYKLKETLIINNEENTEFFDYNYTLETIDELAKQFGVLKE